MKDNVLILDEYKRKKNKSTSLEAYILQIESEIESLIKERKETLYAQLIDSFRDLADHLEPKYIQWWRKLAGTYEKREQEKKKQSEERQARDKDRKIKLREYNTQFFARLLTLIDYSPFTILSPASQKMPSSIVYIPFDDNLWQVRITLDKASNEGKDPEKEWFNDYDIFVSGGIIESSLSEVRQKPVKSLFEACLFEPNRVLPFDFSLIGAAAHIFKRYNSSSLNPGEIIPQYFNPPQAEDNTVLQRMIK